MLDHFYSEYLGRYVVVGTEGDTVLTLEMTKAEPAGKPKGSALVQSLEAYLGRGTWDFSRYKVNTEGMTPFQRRVLEAIRRIPPGETRTYGEVARAVDRPGAARAVGNVMAMNPIPLILPCHRVVATNGLGGFTGGPDVKRKLLELEGAL